ncbi:MAG: TetR/AcrR family transcriptional regulator [Rhodospirillaceae bacterium]|jgi:AcrR family transcriptional regulator|nr:TetR/AcrR family transcriptional regulator [Rhodospirillaceae bacterium]MBT5945647.1 TetR/AcrR family transcriptional regulator [Rhodospirillaceae bacterium]MBT6404599.1 TetR/AcrR family transcriptional regulator [Rhodospirillaceae bacterium]MBT6535302.1 TetR/AcrR family transcriptional regulator [Rhodospirillaceae bacterium]
MAQVRKRSRSAGETKALIIQEAAKLFASRGYERTSLGAIASAIGISAPALYYHFDSKDEILYATLENTLVQLNLMSAEGVTAAGPSPVAQLRSFVRAHVQHDVGNVDIMPMLNAGLYNVDQLIGGLPATRRRKLIQMQRSFLDRLREILNTGKKDGVFAFENTTTTAFAIIGIVDFAVYWFRTEGALTVEDLADQYGDLAVRMAGAARVS